MSKGMLVLSTVESFIRGCFVGNEYLVIRIDRKPTSSNLGEHCTEEVEKFFKTVFTIDVNIPNTNEFPFYFIEFPVEPENEPKDIVVEFFGKIVTMDPDSLSRLNDDNLEKITADHIGMVQGQTFRSLADVKAALNPWHSQLGIANARITSACNFKEKEYSEFKDNPSKFELFKRFSCAHKEKLNDLNVKFSDVKVPADFSGIKYPQGCFDNFMLYPFHDEKFIEMLEGFSVEELREIIHYSPIDAPMEETIIILNKMVKEFREKNVPFIIRQGDALYRTLFDNLNDELLDFEEMGTLYNSVVQNYVWREGYRLIMGELFEAPELHFSSLSEIHELSELIADGKTTKKWVVNSDTYDDYTLLKLHEKLGAVSTVEVIKVVAESDEVLTHYQWMEYLKNREVLNDVPVSWWKQLLGDS